jgi:hypothetical protein
MSDKTEGKGIGRRAFLRAVGTGAAAGAAIATLTPAAAEAKAENVEERKKARYRETDHVKTYYRTNRL